MTYTPPDAQTIKDRFPEFASLSDTRINFVIEEALRFVDDSWIEADYAPALRFLVAHMLSVEGALDGGQSALQGPLTSQKLGDSSETYAAKSSIGGLDSELTATTYGQRFLALRNSNHPGIKIV